MRNFYRAIFVLTAAICFLTFNFVSAAMSAEIRPTAEPTPTPKTKKSETRSRQKASQNATKSDAKSPATKKTASKTSQPTAPPSGEKPAAQIIVTAAGVIVRGQPSAKAARLTTVKLGKVLPVTKRGTAFYQVEYETGKGGWIATSYTRDFEADRRDNLYREIGEKYLKTKIFDFATASEVTDFLRMAQATVKTDEARADLSFKRLLFIAAALKAIPDGKGERFPYKNFIKANDRDIVFSEPAAQWYLRSESLWDLREKFAALPIAEEIAWTAANNPLAGECEGYINCYLYNIRAADGEYLNFYPNGEYAQKSLTKISNYLEPFVADIKEKTVYTPPSDISDRAEFNRFLTELRAIVSKVPSIEKNKVLKQINDLGEGYK